MTKSELEQLSEKLLVDFKSKKSVNLKSSAKKYKTDLANLISAVTILKDWGYRFRITKDSAKLISVPDRLIDTEISYNLKTKTIGQKIYAYQKLKSTNDNAARFAETGESEGSIVVAEEQTRGRGRLGRQWHSPAGAGIYLSIILKPKFKPEFAPGLSIMTAVALADTINEYLPGKVKIKWPNDILINNKKVAGILTELSSEKNKINYVIIGAGINVNNNIEDFPEELINISTSIRRVLRKKVDRIEFLQKFLSDFEKEYNQYKKNRLKPAHKKIKRYSSLIGSTVKLRHNKKRMEGKATDIDQTGALIVNCNGKLIKVTSGEVTVVK